MVLIMNKKIVIKKCTECEFHETRTSYSILVNNLIIKEHSCWNHKLNHLENEEKIICDENIIPDFCPLEDDVFGHITTETLEKLLNNVQLNTKVISDVVNIIKYGENSMGPDYMGISSIIFEERLKQKINLLKNE